MFGALAPGPEVPETPVDITQTTFGVPPPVDMTPPAAPVMTTSQVNGDPNIGGSIDGGGDADQICAWWVGQSNPNYHSMVNLQQANQRFGDQYGVPLFVPSAVGYFKSLNVMLLGGLYGGYHGWLRSGGKWGAVLGYGLLTALFPPVGVVTSIVQGPFRKRRK